MYQVCAMRDESYKALLNHAAKESSPMQVFIGVNEHRMEASVDYDSQMQSASPSHGALALLWSSWR